MSVVIVSVDPGLSGACAVLDHNGLRAVFDIPTMPIPGVGPKAMIQKKVDGRALVRELRKHCTAADAVRSVIEAVRVMAGKDRGGKDNTIQSQGSLLRTLGAVETVLECMAWAPEYVAPQTWKRHFGLIDSDLTAHERKAKALDCARRLYPDRIELARAKDHNRAEAVLIGHFFRMTSA